MPGCLSLFQPSSNYISTLYVEYLITSFPGVVVALFVNGDVCILQLVDEKKHYRHVYGIVS